MKERTWFVIGILFAIAMLPNFLCAQATISVDGYFGGDLSYHASGDTIMFVIKEGGDHWGAPAQSSLFYLSLNGGEDWQETRIPYLSPQMAHPSLTVLGDRILVAAGSKLFESTDLGANWLQLEDLDPTRELTPYIFERNGTLSLFQLNMPYPQILQDKFVFNSDDDDPVELFKPYRYFADSFLSPNQIPMRFTGFHVFDGIVGGASDMYIRQTGGGDNAGWPTFLEPVLLGGEAVSSPSNYPESQIFQGGIFENMDISKLPTPAALRNEAQHIGQGEGHIYLIEVNGGAYTGWHGTLSEPRQVQIPVYDQYPPNENSEILFTNTYTVRDTVWTPGLSGVSFDRSLFVHGDLWIKGDFAGKQTWGATGEIRIIGDILLAGTDAPQAPPLDSTDMVNLVSEKKISLAYGYVDPVDSTRIHPFLSTPGNPRCVYANLYALGYGEREGVVEFEYQHPHPSTPAVYYDNGIDSEQLYENIDLHRHRYPPTAAEPWPPHLDLPYYNPLWPEANPYLERGEVMFFGNIFQRQIGYMHRSGNDAEYPSNSGVWDIENDFCGGPVTRYAYPDPVLGDDLILQAQNFANNPGSGVGYVPSYMNDSRHAMIVDEEGMYTKFWQHGMRIFDLDEDLYDSRYGSLFFEPIAGRILSKCMGQRDGKYAFAANDRLLFIDGEALLNLSDLTLGGGNIRTVQIGSDMNVFILPDKPYLGQHVVARIDPWAGVSTGLFGIDSSPWPGLVAMHLTDGGRLLMAKITEYNSCELYELLEDNEFQLIGQWDIWETYHTDRDRLYMKSAGESTVDFFFYESPVETASQVRHMRVQIPTSGIEDSVPALDKAMLVAYPNPARQAMNIELKMPRHKDFSVDIYNIRGQKVRSLHSGASKADGSYDLSWDLKDSKAKSVSRGVYIMRLTIDGKAVINKRISVQ